jgi:hypothetical protein
MKAIQIFTSKKAIDIEKLINTRLLICANSGGGKSYAIRKLLEESADQVPAIIFDVEGEFKTLREKYDFLLIGDKTADVLLDPAAAGLLPEKILQHNVSTIIDISELRMHDRIKYVQEFLESLMDLPQSLWKPFLIVLDEAHLFCGQQEKQDSFKAVIDLMTRGRKRGYCGILLTQRISKLHKDAAAEANNKLIGRTGLDIDMKRASDELGFTSRSQTLSLRDLEPGEFYTFGPAISKHVEKEWIAQVKTTHPKVGMDISTRIVKPTEKISRLLSQLSDLKPSDNVILSLDAAKNRIIQLEAQLAQPREPTVDPAIAVAQQANIIQLKQSLHDSRIVIPQLRALLANHQRIFDSMRELLSQTEHLIIPDIKNEILAEDTDSVFTQEEGWVQADLPKQIETPTTQLYTNQNKSTSLGRCASMIYSFLAHNPTKRFTKQQIGAVTGYAHTSGGFNNALGQLRSLCLISGSSNDLHVEQMKQEYVGNYDFSPTKIMSSLGKCEAEIFDVVKKYLTPMTKEVIAQRTPSQYSPSSGGFNNALGRLNTLGLIKRENGKIVCHPDYVKLLARR